MTTLFALPAQNNFGDNVPDGVAGPMGLFITVLLIVATVLLIRNMNSRLRRLPASFPPPGSRAGQDGQAAPEPGGPGPDAPAQPESGPEESVPRS